MLTDEYKYKILKIVEAKPDISQRELAKNLGVSLGKVNFCLKALVEKGLIKAGNFRNSKNKIAYMYLLTPRGVVAKVEITGNYLKSKMDEFERIQYEIKSLQRDLEEDVVIDPKKE